MSVLKTGVCYLTMVLFMTACGGGGGSDSGGNNNNAIVSGPADVTYDVSFVSEWSATTHPDNFPSGSAHFSGLVGATHNASASFWNNGEIASAGIKAMAELGQQSILNSEVNLVIQQSNADKVILGNGLATTPDTLNFTLPMQTSHPLLTLVSMLAPSPDWFVGVSGLNLYEGNIWVDSLTVELFAYDSGTDSGATYSSPDQATLPAEPIQKIITTPFMVSGNIVPIGKFIFTLQ